MPDQKTYPHTPPEENKSAGRKAVRHLVYYILAAILIYYFILASISPVRYIRSLNSNFTPDSVSLSKTGPEYLTDSLYLDLTGRLAFARARTRMAATDSIGITVSLPDSVITIEIKGVTVRKIRIVEYSVAGSLRGVEDYTWTRMLAEPFTVESEIASIPKEPVMVKIAPRDTAEASAMPNIVPDTSGIDPVFFRLHLSKGLRLTVLQVTGRDSRKDAVALNRFIYRRKMNDLLVSAKHVARFRFPPYKPEIRIVVPKEEARVIYRAIPVSGEIVLRVK